MLFSNIVIGFCVAESFDLLDGYSFNITIAKDIQIITSDQLV
jgi:hypothetical protein